MTAPAGRILALGVSPNLAPVPYTLNAAADTACCRGLGAPDRLQHADDFRRSDGAGRQAAHDRAGVSLQRRAPLPAMFGVPPSRLLVGKELFNRLPPCY